MRAKPTLYELLGVHDRASVTELQAGFRQQANALEAARGTLASQDFQERMQLLRLALSTLADPVTRLGYDNKLAAAARAAQVPVLALAPGEPAAAAAAALHPVPEVRADALALRADALSLRADAMLARAGTVPPGLQVAQTVAGGTLKAMKYVTRAIGLLVLVAVGAFLLTRCGIGSGPAGVDRRQALEDKAHEQTALQEYYQTHGVRPASMAELELLEADRRRRENQAREQVQDRDKQEREQRRFEEESRRIGREAAANLQAAEEQARREAERERLRAQREAEIKQMAQRQQEEADRRRIEQEKREWREVLRR